MSDEADEINVINQPHVGFTVEVRVKPSPAVMFTLEWRNPAREQPTTFGPVFLTPERAVDVANQLAFCANTAHLAILAAGGDAAAKEQLESLHLPDVDPDAPQPWWEKQ